MAIFFKTQKTRKHWKRITDILHLVSPCNIQTFTTLGDCQCRLRHNAKKLQGVLVPASSCIPRHVYITHQSGNMSQGYQMQKNPFVCNGRYNSICKRHRWFNVYRQMTSHCLNSTAESKVHNLFPENAVSRDMSGCQDNTTLMSRGSALSRHKSNFTFTLDPQNILTD